MCVRSVEKDPRGALMFFSFSHTKAPCVQSLKAGSRPPGALPFLIRIYNGLSMGLPIQSEYYVIRNTWITWPYGSVGMKC